MRAAAAVAATAFLLAACGGSTDKSGNNGAQGKAGEAAGNSAVADAATPAAPPQIAGPGPQSIQPGQWEMTQRLAEVDMPGAPPQVLAQIRARQNRPPQTSRTCISAEQAANPMGQFREMMTRGQRGATCQPTDTVFGGGVIRISVVCRGTGGGPSQGRFAMEGTFTGTTIQARVSIDAQGPAPGGRPGTQTMRMSTTLSGRRVGECPAGAGARPPAR
jgi:Protein of unknown function (DUF3617)